ncbi:MAG TPA: HD domain-containing protein [Bacteroidales bacterium]|nr:HD domain-containing protein [Bacteroidales bacterium]
MIHDSIINICQTVENSLKSDIESFFLSIYPPGHLISHGLEHHKRVWRFAKEIILNTGSMQSNIDQHFVEQLMIACYLHDTGMAFDHSIKHGVRSRKKAVDYLESRKKNLTEFNKTLEAIEYHDDKDYSAPYGDNIILSILSIADDLDAFGFTGIYRYADIYVRRNIKNSSLGILIRKNASSRFKNLNSNTFLSSDLKRKHSYRYMILDSFFEKYNKELSHYIFGTSSPSGYCGLIEIISSCVYSENENEFSNILLKYSNDPVINWFLNGLISELNNKE